MRLLQGGHELLYQGLLLGRIEQAAREFERFIVGALHGLLEQLAPHAVTFAVQLSAGVREDSLRVFARRYAFLIDQPSRLRAADFDHPRTVEFGFLDRLTRARDRLLSGIPLGARLRDRAVLCFLVRDECRLPVAVIRPDDHGDEDGEVDQLRYEHGIREVRHLHRFTPPARIRSLAEPYCAPVRAQKPAAVPRLARARSPRLRAPAARRPRRRVQPLVRLREPRPTRGPPQPASLRRFGGALR